MLKIWGRLTSVNVRKVVWAAQELGITFERVDAGRQFGIVDTPAYHFLNPNGLVPTIEDDGFVLWESNTIVRYFGARHGVGSFYPEDLRQRFDAERWMDWQQTRLGPACSPVFWQWIRTPAEQRDMAAIAGSVARAQPLLALLDAHLADRAFMLGDTLTMADIPLGCEVHRWYGLPQERPALPNLERWFAALSARPAVKGVFDIPLS